MKISKKNIKITEKDLQESNLFRRDDLNGRYVYREDEGFSIYYYDLPMFFSKFIATIYNEGQKRIINDFKKVLRIEELE